MLQNDYLVAKIGFHSAENEPSQILENFPNVSLRKCQILIRFTSEGEDGPTDTEYQYKTEHEKHPRGRACTKNIFLFFVDGHIQSFSHETEKENTFTVRTTSSDRCVFRNFSWMIGSGPGNAGKSMLTARICQPMWVCLAAVAVAHAGAGAAHANLDICAGIWISLC